MKIDIIYIINLPERKDRFEECQQECINQNIGAVVEEAIKDSNGAVGLKKTMNILFSKIVSHPRLKNVLVLEDDFKMLGRWSDVEKFCSQVPEDYDLAYLGCNMLTMAEKVSNNVIKIGSAYATHAIIYSRQAILKIGTLLDRYQDQEKAYDQILQNHIQQDGKCYCSYPMLVTQRDSYSDIANFDAYWEKENLRKYLDKEKRIVKWGMMMEEKYEFYTKHLKDVTA